MPRKATGSVIEPKDRRAWALRFRAHGKRRYVALGRSGEGWDRARAERELRHVLADVERGIWQPPASEPERSSAEVPTFHEFASEWFEGISPELRERTRVDYRWRLSSHLLPYFADHRLSAITVEQVDRYRRAKVRESKEIESARQKQLGFRRQNARAFPAPCRTARSTRRSDSSPRSWSRPSSTATSTAIPQEVASGSSKRSKPPRSYLQPEQVAALLGAAGELDAESRNGIHRRRALLATLALAGLRIGEALDLRWRNVSLDGRRLQVDSSKTDAGIREVDLTPVLRDLLAEHRAGSSFTKPTDFVFATREGHRDNPSNVRNRLFVTAVEQANKTLRAEGREPIGTVTPHSLRRTFISLLLAAGADVPYVMAQAGHSDPKMTLGLYAKVIASRTDHGASLDKLVKASTDLGSS